MLLAGDAVILAGATGRVGGATLATFVREGAFVTVVTRNAARARAAITAQRIAEPEQIERLLICEADLEEPEDGEAVTRATVERFGRVDAVANLAGHGKFVALVDSTPDDLRLNLDGFVLSTYNLLLPALRQMLRQPPRLDPEVEAAGGAAATSARGRLVTVTAGSSKDPQPKFGLFGAAKAGVNVLMQAIAREHKADGIVANAVVLGGVATDAARSYLDADAFAAAATPQEVANVVAFLCSARATGINGALVDVNAREVD